VSGTNFCASSEDSQWFAFRKVGKSGRLFPWFGQSRLLFCKSPFFELEVPMKTRLFSVVFLVTVGVALFVLALLPRHQGWIVPQSDLRIQAQLRGRGVGMCTTLIPDPELGGDHCRVGVVFFMPDWLEPGRPVSDDDLALVKDFSALRYLTIHSGKITDKGLEHLTGLPLDSLSIDNVPDVSDHGLAHLTQLPLTKLWLSGMPVTSRGLSPLLANPRLMEVNISNVEADEECVLGLEHCPNLKELRLRGIKLSARSLGVISKLTSLKTLSLHRCGIRDNDLWFLKSLPNLTSVSLDDNEVADAGMRAL
jgi:hypothetical protein